MKIRLFFFLFSSLLLHTKNTNAQTNEFAPVGAKWWYEVTPDIIGTTYQLYYQYEVEKDTLIDGINAAKVVAYRVQNDGTRVTVGFEYFRKDSTKIDFYRNGIFHTFIDYNSVAGDTINVINEEFNGFFEFQPYLYNSFSYRIDSIRDDLYDGIVLKTFYVSSLEESDYWFGDFSFTTKIVETIGAINDISILGFPSNIGFFGGIKGLSCYEEVDNQVSFNGGNCDSLFNWINDSETIEPVSLIYSDEFIKILFSINAEHAIYITDIHGSIVLFDIVQGDFYITKNDFCVGIYILNVIDENGKNIFKKKLFIN
jgi:hypothetical protein